MQLAIAIFGVSMYAALFKEIRYHLSRQQTMHAPSYAARWQNIKQTIRRSQCTVAPGSPGADH